MHLYFVVLLIVVAVSALPKQEEAYEKEFGENEVSREKRHGHHHKKSSESSEEQRRSHRPHRPGSGGRPERPGNGGGFPQRPGNGYPGQGNEGYPKPPHHGGRPNGPNNGGYPGGGWYPQGPNNGGYPIPPNQGGNHGGRPNGPNNGGYPGGGNGVWYPQGPNNGFPGSNNNGGYPRPPNNGGRPNGPNNGGFPQDYGNMKHHSIIILVMLSLVVFTTAKEDPLMCILCQRLLRDIKEKLDRNDDLEEVIMDSCKNKAHGFLTPFCQMFVNKITEARVELQGEDSPREKCERINVC
ncbi:hypothetical protein Q1695_010587 [Nippostrongylus brasiliensis]|nr:hypothetical protein Q1695_010587 [Nippostrongylus brasiliensis]